MIALPPGSVPPDDGFGAGSSLADIAGETSPGQCSSVPPSGRIMQTFRQSSGHRKAVGPGALMLFGAMALRLRDEISFFAFDEAFAAARAETCPPRGLDLCARPTRIRPHKQRLARASGRLFCFEVECGDSLSCGSDHCGYHFALPWRESLASLSSWGFAVILYGGLGGL